MHYQHIPLILIVLLAVAVNAATNIAHTLHPSRRQTGIVHSGDVLLPRRRWKVLWGGANSPLMQPSSRRQNSLPTWCHVVRTQISRPHLALKRYERRVHTMNEFIVSIQPWAGSADDDEVFCWAAKTVAGNYIRLINLKGDIDFLAGGCWRMKNQVKNV